MPILLSNYKDAGTNVPITWWVIRIDMPDRLGQQLSSNQLVTAWNILVQGYVDKASYLAGFNPVQSLTLNVSPAVYWPYLASLTTQDYAIGTPLQNLLGLLQAQFEIAVAAANSGVVPIAGGTVVNPTTYKAYSSQGPGNYTVAHGLGYSPSGAFILNEDQQAPQRAVLFQTPTKWDATNFYFNSVASGVPFLVQVWQ